MSGKVLFIFTKLFIGFFFFNLINFTGPPIIIASKYNEYFWRANCRLNPDFVLETKQQFIKTMTEVLSERFEKKTHFSEQSCQNKHHVYQKRSHNRYLEGEIGKQKHLWPLTTKYQIILIRITSMAKPTYSFLVFNIDKILTPLTIWLGAAIL